MTYSNSIAVSRQRFAAKNQNITAFKTRKGRIGPVSNTVILIVLSCLLGLLYLTQVTKTNAFSYQINDLQGQQTQLQSQNQQLELNSAQLQSVEKVAASAQAQQMASVTPTAVAQN